MPVPVSVTEQVLPGVYGPVAERNSESLGQNSQRAKQVWEPEHE
jgi:hypothetical protein